MRWLALAFCCMFATGLLLAQDKKKEDFWSEKEVKLSVGELIQRIQTTEDEAIKLLSDEQSLGQKPHAAYQAIKYLKTIRSVKAIPTLCDRLLYEQRVVLYDEIVDDRLSRPATAALVAIGTPSVDGLLNKIASTEKTHKYREVATDILRDIVGKDRVVRSIDEFRVIKDRNNTDDQQKRLDIFRKEFKERYRHVLE